VRRALKLALLFAFRLVGGFFFCRLITSDKVRILCYHGISIGDQHDFEPILFMRQETFQRRMEFIRRRGCQIVTLSDGVAMIETGDIRGCPTVVTIDDGWKGTFTRAVPVLTRLSIPATVYITTYYSERRTDVFNVALRYLFWKSKCLAATLKFGDPRIDGPYDLTQDRAAVANRWLDFAEHHLDCLDRQRFLEAAAQALGLDASGALADERFRIMDRSEVSSAAEQGLDIELHTHRHRLPRGAFAEMQTEIEDNRRLLEAWSGRRCLHFCYPSGQYAPEHPMWLKEMGVRSATTCDSGLCASGANLFVLPRILDRENWTMLEFEAALCGVDAVFGRQTEVPQYAL